MRFVHSRALWFLTTLLVLMPVLVIAHTETGRALDAAVLYSLITAAAIGGLNAALVSRRRHSGPSGEPPAHGRGTASPGPMAQAGRTKDRPRTGRSFV
ncbi:hypothetical protein ACX80N_02680 [Arthrobacter sp. MDT2-16]